MVRSRNALIAGMVALLTLSPTMSRAWIISETKATDPNFDISKKLGLQVLVEVQQFFTRLVVAEQTNSPVNLSDTSSLRHLAQDLNTLGKGPESGILLTPSPAVRDLIAKDAETLGFNLPKYRGEAYLLVADKIKVLANQMDELKQFGPLDSANATQRQAFNQILSSIARILLVGSDMAAMLQS